MKDTKELENTKQEISEFITKFVENHKLKENFKSDIEDLNVFFVKKAIEVLGIETVSIAIIRELLNKKLEDRQLMANMLALANLIKVNEIDKK